MKKIILTAFVASFALVSCDKKEEAVKTEASTEIIDPIADEMPMGDNSKTSVDWAGTYEGTLPCADCEGIQTTITLNSDDTYALTSDYLGKDHKFEDKGSFSWSEDGNKISVTYADGQMTQFQVGENQLIQLDQEGNRITGPMADLYILAKK